MSSIDAPSAGHILTWYSYKGGTGRSMALANLAWILAAAGKRVLVIDWDLEAPGLHRYFRPFLIDEELTSSEGLLDMVDAYASEAIRPMEPGSTPKPDWFLKFADFTRYVLSINFGHFPGRGKIDLLPAGRQSDTYALKVASFNWQNFYDRLGGGGFFEAVKARARAEYDFVLIDSRTGVSDTAGICTVQMPDTLVVCFTYNNQSIKGASAVARSATNMRKRQEEDQRTRPAHAGVSPGGTIMGDSPRPYRVFPVPMRVDEGESERLTVRQAFARSAFADLLRHLDPSRQPEYWSGVEVPQRVYYSYEEVLSPFKDDVVDPKTLLAAFVRLAGHLTDGEVATYRLSVAPAKRQELLASYAKTPLDSGLAREALAAHEEREEDTLSRLADDVMGRLSEEEQVLARRSLTRLVRLGRAEEGGGILAVRARLSDFSEAETAVVAKLAQGGLVVVARDGGTMGDGVARQSVSLSNDRLPHAWRPFAAWLETDREFLVWRQQLRNYCADWTRSERDDAALLSGHLLAEADLWRLKRHADLSLEEIEYINASRAASREMTRRAESQEMPAAIQVGRRLSAVVLATLSVFLLGLIAFREWRGLPVPSVTTRPSPSASGIDETQVRSLIELGDVAAGSGDMSEARSFYLSAATLRPGDPAILLRLGRAHASLGDVGAASRAYDEAIRLVPQDSSAFLARGILRSQQGDEESALTDFDRAISLDPTNGQFHFLRGVANENLGETSVAIRDYSRAIELKQDNAEAYLSRAKLNEKVDRSRAIADYRSVLTLSGAGANARTTADARLKALDVPTTPSSTKADARRVVLHYYDSADARAVSALRRTLADKLRGSTVAPGQLVSARSDGDVRFFFREDEKWASEVRNAAEAAAAGQGYRLVLRVLFRDAKSFPQSRRGTVEVWLPSLTRPSPRLSSRGECGLASMACV